MGSESSARVATLALDSDPGARLNLTCVRYHRIWAICPEVFSHLPEILCCRSQQELVLCTAQTTES
jgi:hypothetical protein